MTKTQTARYLLGESLAEPAKYKWVQNELSQYLVQKTYKDLGQHKAFVLRRIGTMSGDVYKMFINSTEHPNVQKYLESHEAGHIIFGHNSGEKTKDRINKMKIKAVWPKVKDYFPNPEDWELKFDNLIYNLVMDMEVNSKVFTHTEMENLNEALGGEGIWPEDFDFPVGLDYNTYLNLILQDPSKFLDNLQNNSKGNNDSQDGDSDEGDSQDGQENEQQNGEGGSQDSSSGNGVEEDNYDDLEQAKKSLDQSKDKTSKEGQKQTDSKNEGAANSGTKDNNNHKRVRTGHKFTEEELDELQKYYEENDKALNEKKMNELEAAEFENPSNDYSSGSSLVGHAQKALNSVGMVSFKTIESDLTKVVSKVVSENKRDQLYNYNRNKHNSNIIIPRITKAEKVDPACLYILLDVSGSISEASICQFVESFKSVASRLNKKSRIILWDTDLVSDNSVRDKITPMSGGGTFMSLGIKYISKKYSPSPKDYFIMVSDFEDSLDAWNDELKLLKCNKLAYIFNYGCSETSCEETFKEMGNYIRNSDMNEVKDLWKNTKGINISA